MTMSFKLSITTPTRIAQRDTDEFEFVGDDSVAVLYAHVATDGNPEWGIPLTTAVTVAAERWHGSMDDDGDGEPVTDVADLAALLGCEATPDAVARCVYHDHVMDRALSRWEARYA